jgi:hypothetical protein
VRENWYYVDHKHQVGPLTLSDLRATLVAAGNVQEIFVWSAGFPDWKPVRDVPELSDLVKKRALPVSQFDIAQNKGGESMVASHSKEPPIIGIVGAGLGLASIIMPYFAAVFFVPAALICGAIALMKRQVGWGVLAIALSLLGAGAIIYTSHQITSIFTSHPGRISLPQPAFSRPPVVTQAQYDRILDGMTYEEVRNLNGTSGQVLSRSNLAGTTTVMYSWANSNGSNMSAMFQNDRLVNKAQFGLP